MANHAAAKNHRVPVPFGDVLILRDQLKDILPELKERLERILAGP